MDGSQSNLSIEAVKGVGPAMAQNLASAGIRTVSDLIEYFPRKYEDYSNLTPIKALKPGPVSFSAKINQVNGRYIRRGMHITEAIASDESGSVRLIWFNQPYRTKQFKAEMRYFVSGKFTFARQRLAVMNPSVELASDFPINTARIVPVYPQTKGLKSTQIRKLIKNIAQQITAAPEFLPKWLVADNALIPRGQAVFEMHFPSSMSRLEQARKRLGFDELFELNLASLLNKQELHRLKSPVIAFEQSVAVQAASHLPFQLTPGQKKVTWDIYQDLAKPHPMNRLLEGDVGSGKTVVAAMAAVMAIHHGYQVAYLAPTELLARQHAETIQQILDPLGFGASISLLVGSQTAHQKSLLKEHLTAEHVKIVVGTHALLQDDVSIPKLGLVIIDEQHRFGVSQRQKLQRQLGYMPHMLSMTATPIPRTLALTLYGELEVSILKHKPANRLAVKTKLIQPSDQPAMWQQVEGQINKGRQVFVVCPHIQESDVVPAKAVETVYSELRQRFKNYRVGLLHGKLPAPEKNAAMEAFVQHKVDILVSTTVVEVGVDVPNATVMVIESADRFGLAQLHQLRGRVGRSNHQGFCYLLLPDNNPPSDRLRALEQSQDGFALAELDLQRRGPGAIYGTYQHGALDLRVTRLDDVELINQARQAAKAFMDKAENLLDYKQLYERVKAVQAVTNLN